MLIKTRPQVTTRQQMVNGLARFRTDWEELANGESLIDVEGSVGLNLADVVKALGFTPSEASAVLGAELSNDVEGFIESRRYQPI